MYVLNYENGDNVVVWDGDTLKRLIKSSGLSRESAAEAIGISQPSLCAYMNGVVPSLSATCRMANFFGITLDEMVGKKKAEGLEEYLECEHSKIVDAVKRMYTKKVKNKVIKAGGKEIAMWPYNFLDAVFGEWSSVLTADQEEGLRRMMMMLDTRECNMVLMYYRDGKTLEEVGKEYRLTRERVRQIIMKATRKMRHKAVSQFVLYGYNRAKEIESKKLDDKKETEVNKIEQAKPVMGMSIKSLGLSTRAYNALTMNKGIKTVGELVEFASEGKMLKMRNLGVTSVAEICQKLNEKTGLNYLEINMKSDRHHEQK